MRRGCPGGHSRLMIFPRPLLYPSTHAMRCAVGGAARGPRPVRLQTCAHSFSGRGARPCGRPHCARACRVYPRMREARVRVAKHTSCCLVWSLSQLIVLSFWANNVSKGRIAPRAPTLGPHNHGALADRRARLHALGIATFPAHAHASRSEIEGRDRQIVAKRSWVHLSRRAAPRPAGRFRAALSAPVLTLARLRPQIVRQHGSGPADRRVRARHRAPCPLGTSARP